MNMKHSLFGFRPTRHLALGLGAAGLVLGASGASVAATALIQPAGALSVQVPAVAVREQNVNSAGRIRVALPKTSVGVNGTVAVSNLPLNSNGRVQTQNGTGVSHEFEFGERVSGSSPITLAHVNGSGVFEGIDIGDNQVTGNATCYNLTVVTDGTTVFNDGWGTAATTSPVNQANSEYVSGPNQAGGYAMAFTPSGGLPFQHSLLVQTYAYNCGGNSAYVVARGWYTTNS
ncbi:MAG: hypothetical protein M0035_03445 [Actinomycetota bacterium]|nr:hypothetical protein [Actinomycetota bacterium]